MKDDKIELIMVYCVFVGETNEKLVDKTNPMVQLIKHLEVLQWQFWI